MSTSHQESETSTTRRVVFTGLGPISAFGQGIEPLWAAMLEGRSGITSLDSRFDASGFECPFAASLPGESFDVRKVVPKTYRKATKVMARDTELAVGAAAIAVADAGLVTRATDGDEPRPFRLLGRAVTSVRDSSRRMSMNFPPRW